MCKYYDKIKNLVSVSRLMKTRVSKMMPYLDTCTFYVHWCSMFTTMQEKISRLKMILVFIYI